MAEPANPTNTTNPTDEPRIVRMKLRDALAQGIIKRDPRNANTSTERGRYMIETSMEKTGLGRGIVLDKDGYIPAGNQTVDIAAELFDDADIIIVETDGKQLVATRRVDFDLMDDHGAARQYAYADNRAAVESIFFSSEQLLVDIEAGIDLSDWFHDDELDRLLASGNVPTFEPVSQSEQPRLDEKKKVECPNCGHQFTS